MFKTDETRQATWLTLCIWLLSGLLFSVTHAVLICAITARVLATVAAMNLFGIIASIGLYQAALRTRRQPMLLRVGALTAAAVVCAFLLGLVDVSLMEFIRKTFEPATPPSSMPNWRAPS